MADNNIVIGQGRGRDPQGKTVVVPIGGIAAWTNEPLVAGASYETAVIPYNGLSAIQVAFSSDTKLTFRVSYYSDASTQIDFMGQDTPFDPTSSTVFQAGIAAKGAYGVKIKVTNTDSVNQSNFYFEARLEEQIQQTLRTIGTPVSATNLAGTSHVVIEGREAATGAYKQATVSVVDTKTALDVNVINRSNETQKVAIEGTPTVNANVSFPSTQAISGTVNVANFPTTQPVSGSVGIAGTPTVNANVTFPNTQSVNIAQAVATLPVRDYIWDQTEKGNAFVWTSGIMSVTIALSNMKLLISNPSNSGKVLHVFSLVVDNASAADQYGQVYVNPTNNLPTTNKGTGLNLYAGHPNTSGGITVFADVAGNAMSGGVLVSNAFLPNNSENELLKGARYIIPPGVKIGMNIPYVSLLNSVMNQVVLYGIVLPV